MVRTAGFSVGVMTFRLSQAGTPIEQMETFRDCIKGLHLALSQTRQATLVELITEFNSQEATFPESIHVF